MQTQSLNRQVAQPQQTFPRYNIIEGEKSDTEERFTIELAVGFTR